MKLGACLTSVLIFACLGIAACAGDDDPKRWVKLDALRPEDNSREALWVVASSNYEAYARACDPQLEVTHWSGSEWVPLQDDRPFLDSEPRYYYLDGMFEQAMLRTACKGNTCVRHTGFQSREGSFFMLPAREYVQVGTKQAPDATAVGVAGAGAGEAASEVPEIESRLLTGQIQVTLFYYTDEDCASPRLEISDEVMFPDP
jgi:hypothetical protein